VQILKILISTFFRPPPFPCAHISNRNQDRILTLLSWRRVVKASLRTKIIIAIYRTLSPFVDHYLLFRILSPFADHYRLFRTLLSFSDHYRLFRTLSPFAEHYLLFRPLSSVYQQFASLPPHLRTLTKLVGHLTHPIPHLVQMPLEEFAFLHQ